MLTKCISSLEHNTVSVLPHTTFLEGRTWHLENGASNIVSMSTMLNLSVPVQNVLSKTILIPSNQLRFFEHVLMKYVYSWSLFI